MRLKLAIQKSGRLHDDSIKLLKESGIDIGNGVNKLKADATNFPLELFFLRDDDIPQYVEDGVADIGFVGENVVYEKAKKVEVAYELGFGKCRLSFAVKKSETFSGPNFLSGKKLQPVIQCWCKIIWISIKSKPKFMKLVVVLKLHLVLDWPM